MSELKPCPCCGGIAEMRQIYDGENVGAYFVECTNLECGLSTRIMFSCGEDCRPILCEIWNRRAPAAPAEPSAPEAPKLSQAHIAKEADKAMARVARAEEMYVAWRKEQDAKPAPEAPKMVRCEHAVSGDCKTCIVTVNHSVPHLRETQCDVPTCCGSPVCSGRARCVEVGA
jgi:hypothetical protein